MGTQRGAARAVGRGRMLAGLVIAAAIVGGSVAGVSASTAGASAAQAEPPLSVTVSPSTGLQPGQPVQVTVDGPEDRAFSIYQAGAHPVDDSDFQAIGFVEPGPRPTTVTVTPKPWVEGIAGPNWNYCGDCNIVVLPDFEFSLLAYAPIQIDPGPLDFMFQWNTYTSAGPDHWPYDLVTGDQLRVAVRGERATETGVALCDTSVVDSHDVYGGPCTAPQAIPAGDDPVREPLVVSSSFTGNDGTAIRCRIADCVVALASPDGTAFVSRPVSFRGEPLLTVDPATGLADGQVVGVSGDLISPTYDGPPFWFFPVTGHWALAQCDVEVAAQPSIYQVFNHCTNVPGRGEVVVTEGTTDLGTAPVQASITSILGKQTDCAAAPGACALSLVRLEDTGAVTVLNAPLTFA